MRLTQFKVLPRALFTLTLLSLIAAGCSDSDPAVLQPDTTEDVNSTADAPESQPDTTEDAITSANVPESQPDTTEDDDTPTDVEETMQSGVTELQAPDDTLPEEAEQQSEAVSALPDTRVVNGYYLSKYTLRNRNDDIVSVVTYDLDTKNNILSKFEDRGYPEPELEREFSFDATGLVVRRQAFDSAGEVTSTRNYQYNEAGQLIERALYDGISLQSTAIYNYDENGRLVAIDDYDALTNNINTTTDISYDSDQNTMTATYSDDTIDFPSIRTYQLGDDGRVLVESSSYFADRTITSNVSYEYDELGNVISARFYDETGSTFGSRQYEYTATEESVPNLSLHLNTFNFDIRFPL